MLSVKFSIDLSGGKFQLKDTHPYPHILYACMHCTYKSNTHARAPTFTHPLLHTHTHTHARTHARTHAHTHAHTHTYARTHTHPHAHTRTRTRTATTFIPTTYRHTLTKCKLRPSIVHCWKSSLNNDCCFPRIV